MTKLDWIGKQYVVNHADEVPFRLLRRVPLLPHYRERVNL